jgi:hypothetical protein
MAVRTFKKTTLFVLALVGFFVFAIAPNLALADSQGQIKTFFVDPTYDLQKQKQVKAVLEKVSEKAYFYLAQDWLQSLSKDKKEEVDKALDDLAKEFDEKIYPELTSFFGKEWAPGIDNDYHITILFHRMKKGVAGYFDSANEYPKLQSPTSNEREMLYLSSDYLLLPSLKSHLAHEFLHLITFNQKDRLRGVSEEVWLNEARADYAPTYLGYDKDYQNSNLRQRVIAFVGNPTDSLTEWQNEKSDYGVVNIFIQYLAEHYGAQILKDSLLSKKVGIPSLNEALKKNNVNKTIQEIFPEWAIAVFLNNCKFGDNYCFKSDNLKNLKITPSLIFLPSTQKTSVSLDYSIKEWSGNWYRIIGGEGTLKIVFDGEDDVDFDVPYVICQDSKDCQISFMGLDKQQRGELLFKEFGKNWTALTLIPLVHSKISGFGERERTFDFNLSISIESTKEKELIESLKKRIAELKAQIAELQAKINAILAKRNRSLSCGILTKTLYFGVKNDEVRCLQKFLKAQGADIYPEGLITGFFGNLTRNAVVRFQEKYADEILLPLGLSRGTGIVGPSTRAKINELLRKK